MVDAPIPEPGPVGKTLAQGVQPPPPEAQAQAAATPVPAENPLGVQTVPINPNSDTPADFEKRKQGWLEVLKTNPQAKATALVVLAGLASGKRPGENNFNLLARAGLGGAAFYGKLKAGEAADARANQKQVDDRYKDDLDAYYREEQSNVAREGNALQRQSQALKLQEMNMNYDTNLRKIAGDNAATNAMLEATRMKIDSEKDLQKSLRMMQERSEIIQRYVTESQANGTPLDWNAINGSFVAAGLMDVSQLPSDFKGGTFRTPDGRVISIVPDGKNTAVPATPAQPRTLEEKQAAEAAATGRANAIKELRAPKRISTPDDLQRGGGSMTVDSDVAQINKSVAKYGVVSEAAAGKFLQVFQDGNIEELRGDLTPEAFTALQTAMQVVKEKGVQKSGK